MALTDQLALGFQIFASLISLGMVIATVVRELNPVPRYIVLADLVGQVRQSWNKYESEGMAADEFTFSFRLSLERLEEDTRDLLFVLNTNSIKCRFRAWTNTFRIKKLSGQAQLLRVGLPPIAQVNRQLRAAQRHPATRDLNALDKLSRSRDEFMRLIEADLVHIPPVPWSPSLDNFHFRQIGNDSTDSLSETSTLPETITVPEPVFSPPSPSRDLEAGKVSNNKKRSIVKQFFSGILPVKKRNPCDWELSSLPTKG